MAPFVMVDDVGEVKDALAALLDAAGVPVTNGRHAAGPGDTTMAVLEAAGTEQEVVAAIRKATLGVRRAAALDAPETAAAAPVSLSPREREVLELAARGLTADGMAAELFLSVETVRTHTRNAIRKLGARNRLHAGVLAMAAGVIAGPDELR